MTHLTDGPKRHLNGALELLKVLIKAQKRAKSLNKKESHYLYDSFLGLMSECLGGCLSLGGLLYILDNDLAHLEHGLHNSAVLCRIFAVH